jgi:hypothetical protein
LNIALRKILDLKNEKAIGSSDIAMSVDVGEALQHRATVIQEKPL